MAILTILAVFACAVLAICGSVSAEAHGDLEYQFIQGGEAVEITGYSGSGGAVIIPNTIEGKPVVSIGEMAFWDCSSITSVEIPDSVTNICDSAFGSCTSLTTITIPASVVVIGNGTFMCCTSLTSITIPASVTTIGDCPLGQCRSLTAIIVDPANPCYASVDGVLYDRVISTLIQCPGGRTGAFTVPDSVITINFGALNFCTFLTSVTIGHNVTMIGDYAFTGCDGVASIYIPESVTSMDHAFYRCLSLVAINVDPANPNYASADGVLYDRSMTMLIQFPGGKAGAFTIPEGIASIDPDAFASCNGLTSVNIPDSVTSIGQAFYPCPSLLAINVDPANPNYASADGVLYDRSMTTLIQCPGGRTGVFVIPDNTTNIGESAFSYCASLTSITIPGSVTSIQIGAFSYCASLTSITIPDSVTIIGGSAFGGCTSLTSVAIPESVTSIGFFTFYSCTSLTSITIPDSVTIINSYAFFGCTSLTSVTIGDSVTSIGSHVFDSCTSLTSMWFRGDAPSCYESAFLGCSNLTIYYPSGASGFTDPWHGVPTVQMDLEYQFIQGGEAVEITGYSGTGGAVIIPNTIEGKPVVSIGEMAFWGCSSITSVEIPDSVTSIGGTAFGSCTSLTSITIPASVTSIGIGPFEYCTSLLAINVDPANPNYASADGVLYNKPMTTLMQFPGGKAGAFMIPDGVTRVDSGALDSCVSLTSVAIPPSVTIIGLCAFNFCTSLVAINVDPANPNYASADGVLYNRSMSALIQCPGGKAGAFTIPEGVTSLGDHAFEGCQSITSINMPSSLTSIGIWVFGYCTSLIAFNVDPANPNYASADGVLYNRSMTTLMQFPGGKAGAFMIPDGVTSIGGSAFASCDLLTSVTMSDSVTIVGDWAFAFCSGLDSVAIGNGVTSIASFAFYHCTSLISVTIGNSVTIIGTCAFISCHSLDSMWFRGDAPSCTDSAFAGCTALTIYYQPGAIGFTDPWHGVPTVQMDLEYQFIQGGEAVEITGYSGTGGAVIIPNTIEGKPVVSIGEMAFWGCSSITSVEIPDSVTSIGGTAFGSCTSLTSITIPASVTSIGIGPFEYCTSLLAINVDPANPNYASADGVLYNRSMTTLLQFPGGKVGAFTIPDGVTIIGPGAFTSCAALTSVTIGGSVTIIGVTAFGSCTSLLAINVDPSNPNYASADGVLYNRSMTTLIQFPGGKVGAFTIPDGVTSIGDHAFEESQSITSINMPSSLTSIGIWVFGDCTSLLAINVDPANPNYASADGVLYNRSMTTLIQFPGGRAGAFMIPDGVISIRPNAFASCNQLTSVTMSDSVTTIGDWTFAFCSGIDSVAIGNGVTSILSFAFFGCPSLTSVSIGNSIASIGTCAFLSCHSLASMWFQGDAPSCSDSAFAGCTALTIYYQPGASGFTDPWHGVPTIQNTSTPGAPVNLTLTAGNANATLRWQAPLDDGGSVVTFYNIYRGNSSGGPFSRVGQADATWSPTYIDLGLQNGQTYWYMVSAVNAIGEGPQGNHENVMPYTIPGAPSTVTAIVGVANITISWQAPSSDGGSPIINYTVFRALSDGAVPIATVNAATLSFIDTNVTAGVTYLYHVIATNAAGPGPNSTQVSATMQGNADNSMIYLGAILAAIVVCAALAIIISRRK